MMVTGIASDFGAYLQDARLERYFPVHPRLWKLTLIYFCIMQDLLFESYFVIFTQDVCEATSDRNT
jgi:hypothetical protein